MKRPCANYAWKIFFMMMTSMMTSERDDKVSLLYSCLIEISAFSCIIHERFDKSSPNCPYRKQMRRQLWSKGCCKAMGYVAKRVLLLAKFFWQVCSFVTCQNLQFLASMFVCRFVTCQNLQFLASMFVCRFVTCQNLQFWQVWQVCSFVGLSVCLSVLSSITHERFDISSPNLVHIWNGSAVLVCNIDKYVGHGTRSPGQKIG